MPSFTNETIQNLKRFSHEGPAGNRWYKVNLHVHGQGSDPSKLVDAARKAEIDLLAVTDHQSFSYYKGIADAAATPGRKLTVLPGIEITAHEGVHLLAIFPAHFSAQQQDHFYGWLEIPGTGQTTIASKKSVEQIFQKVEHELGGVIVVPHPFADNIGLLAPARKISTKEAWLTRVKLVQLSDTVKGKVRHIGHDDDGTWINRFVLTSANDRQVKASTYSFAPFNRSDAKGPQHIHDGCSWFRMELPSVEGLKQVACEPATRISLEEPLPCKHDAILGLQVTGGYCDQQDFYFSDTLTCIIGPNHAGKSSALDFVRFALGHESHCSAESRARLLARLDAILQAGNEVELYVRHDCDLYVIKRQFSPQYDDGEPVALLDPPHFYSFNPADDTFDPVDDLQFAVEVYEQGRIGLLRDDVSRQLDMLDDFAGVRALKFDRQSVLAALNESAATLKPLYEEREQLKSDVAMLPAIEEELKAKKQLMPDLAEQNRWSKGQQIVDALQEIEDEWSDANEEIPDPLLDDLSHRATQLQHLFSHRPPSIDPATVANPEILEPWIADAKAAIVAVETARKQIVATVRAFIKAGEKHRPRWDEIFGRHTVALRSRLKSAGVDSPSELIARLNTLQQQANTISTKKQPRLASVNGQIQTLEIERSNLITRLRKIDGEITDRRTERAAALTSDLSGKMEIRLEPNADRAEYKRVLNDLVDQVTTKQHRVQNREGQLARIIDTIPPLDLAAALQNQGTVVLGDGTTSTLEEIAEITANTQNILCGIATDISLLNQLQTVDVPDVPHIRVKRQGESTFADLRTGLSPGEQSAAILTLALQTRGMPLILDQPEDELGYSYVVHLIVPKILRAKFMRQLLIVTHNANIPVLGDADEVIKMENHPKSDGSRVCIVTASGCFECDSITKALIELEGGQRAFQFRQHRYTIPRANQPPTPVEQPTAVPPSTHTEEEIAAGASLF